MRRLNHMLVEYNMLALEIPIASFPLVWHDPKSYDLSAIRTPVWSVRSVNSVAIFYG